MTNFNTLISELKRTLSPESRDYLERLAERPEVQRILDEDEIDALAARKALRGRLDSAPDRHAKSAAPVVKRWHTATAKRQAAEQALASARDEEIAADQARLAAGIAQQCELAELERSLRDGADPRLQRAIIILQDLATNQVRSAFKTWADTASKKIASNAEAVGVAREACAAAIGRLQAAQLQPLGRREVERELRESAAQLLAPLAAVGVKLDLSAVGIDVDTLAPEAA
jgi:hypothetical protein